MVSVLLALLFTLVIGSLLVALSPGVASGSLSRVLSGKIAEGLSRDARRGVCDVFGGGWRRLLGRVGHAWAVATRYGSELGGYVHDTAMSQWLWANSFGYTVGTWTFTIVSNVGLMRHTAAANASVIHIPIKLPGNGVAQKGAYLKTIDLWWKNATADLNALTPVVTKDVAPANAAAFPAVTTPAFTYDANHDTAGKRITQASHKMTLTITTPFWIGDGDLVYVELTVDAALTSAVDVYGARANYTLRV